MKRIARSRGFSTMELAIVVAVLGVLGAGSAALVRDYVHTVTYLPNQSRVTPSAGEIQDVMVEGSLTRLPGLQGTWLPGLRHSRQLLLAHPHEVRLRNVNGTEYSICRRDIPVPPQPDLHVVLRSLLVGCPAGNPNTEVIPYHAGELHVGGKLLVHGRDDPNDAPDQGAVIFRYVRVQGNGDETVLIPDGTGTGFTNGTLAHVNRIEIGLVAQTRTGSYALAEGRLEIISSVALRFP